MLKRSIKMKTEYADDLRVVADLHAFIFFTISLGFFIILPLLISDYFLHILTHVVIYSIGVLGQNLLIGYTGLISFGQAGFIAVGAYSFAHTVSKIGLIPAIIVSGAISALIGAIVGIPSLRVKGPFLAIITLGFSIATFQIIQNTPQISGGRMGMHIPKSWGVDSDLEIYYLSLILAYVFFFVGYRIVKSQIGKIFVAIRDSDIAAETLGINVAKYKILSFAISSFYTGAMGGLYAYFMGYLEPTMFQLTESIYMFAAIVIGGIGSVLGSILGSAFVISIPQIFVFMKEYTPLILSILIIIVMIFEPLGLYGVWLRIKLYFMNFPFR
jgi:branched-chain amino acid transport system permease protein